ncbi:hypothetical protein Cni_G05077 [Canna indica]|uniref:Uncharacterized protein n=1 Tax=Canna indica TaxID=4628 RepID=A0AAQ3Q4K8_9LILI|nr:hypothetical protein Cni_G05077 [Canna indica]
MGTGLSKLNRSFITQGHGHAKGVLLAPRGYVPVIVGIGNKSKRFMIHITLLGDARMSELLYVSAEEFRFRNPGVLRIPYDADSFELLMLGKNYHPRIRRVFPFCLS